MIVVLRALKLGDLLVAVPALRAIRRHWPGQRVVLACPGWLWPLVHLAGGADEVCPVPDLGPLPRRLHRPEVAINLHGAGPQSNRVLDAVHPARRVGHGTHGWPGPPWVQEQHERDRWCRMLVANDVPADPTDLYLDRPAGRGGAPGAVLVHPGAAHASRRWPARRFAELIARLHSQGYRVVVTGTEQERELAESVAHRSGADPTVLAGRTSLPDLVELVAGAALLISGDTGVAHLAYAVRTPTVVLFGPASPHRWGPPDGPHVALSCGPGRGDPFADEPDPALLDLGVDAVFTAARGLLDAPVRR